VLWRAAINEEVGQTLENIIGSEPPRHDDGEAASCELVDHREHAEASELCAEVGDGVTG